MSEASNDTRRLTVVPAGGDPLMTLEEVCELLRIPIGSARKQRVEGKFVPGYRIGKYVRFRRSAVLAWIEEHADEI